MADAPDLTKLVPGFDFLQQLVQNAGSAMPGIGQWVAPTLNPEEIEKRIQDLRTVQFWLEQNARMIAATIQALEVQRMTLSTLKTMNVQMDDLREAMTIRMPGAQPPTADETSPGEPASPPADATASPAPGPSPAGARGKAGASAGVVDPMAWWGALTQQFTQLAASAVKEGAADAAKTFAAATTPRAARDAAAPTPARSSADTKPRARPPAPKTAAKKAAAASRSRKTSGKSA